MPLLYGALVVLALVGLFGGYVLAPASLSSPGGSAAVVLLAVGVAGLIALIVAAMSHRLLADELRRQFAQQRKVLELDVIQHVFRRTIPPSISDAIFDHVFRAAFIRSNLRASYTIEPVVDDRFPDRYVRVTLAMAYDVLNLTREPRIYRINTGIDPAPVPELMGDVRFLAFTATDRRGNVKLQLRGEELLPLQDGGRMPTRVKLDIGDGLVIAPQSVISIRIKSQMVKHLDRDYDYFVLNHHTSDCTVTVRADRDLEVAASAFADDIIIENHDHDPDDGFYSWRIDRPMLSQQGLYIGWAKRHGPDDPLALPPVLGQRATRVRA